MLTAEQIAFYEENGYVVVRGMFSRDEAARLREETHALAERLNDNNLRTDATWKAAKDIAGGAPTQLLHCHDVQFQSAIFSRLIVDERLAGAASSIIGPNVQLHHTKMFIKPPEKGSPFPLHQDAPFFPHDNHSMIAAIIHFDDAPLEKGCLRVVPGSFKNGMMPHIAEGSWHLDPAEYPVDSALPLPAQAGDVVLFSYLTIHGSGINTSNEARTTLLVQMRDPLDPPTIRTHESRGQGMMLYGIDPSCATTKPVSEPVAKPAAMGSAMMGGAMSGGGSMMGGAMG